MPWRLIAAAFGWRAAADEDGPAPLLVVWHPRLGRHFSGPDAWKRAVLLSIHAPGGTNAPQAQKESSRSRPPRSTFWLTRTTGRPQRRLRSGPRGGHGPTR